MSTTVKRITIGLTKEQYRQLKQLMEWLGENQNQTVHRALSLIYQDFLHYHPKEEAKDIPAQS